jgi:hypothetical protein
MFKPAFPSALIAAMLFFCTGLFAQDAPGVEWKRIQTAHFTIIYPQEIEKDAMRVADTIEKIYPFARSSIGTGSLIRTNTTLILHTQFAESNGFATPLQRRMEWFNTPPQVSFGGAVDWYQMLGIHEYRHICQFDSLNTGLVFGLYCLLGELGHAAGMATVPEWYFEGDAVMAETLFSNEGRGRTPAFNAEFRMQLLSGKRFAYHKAMLGSYKDHDPLSSPYLLGYYMTAAMRTEHSVQTIESAKRARSWMPIIPYNFDIAVRWYMGEFPSAIYEKTMDDLSLRWKKQLEGLALTGGDIAIPVPSDRWTANRNPRYIDNTTIALVHNSLHEPIHIVSCAGGLTHEIADTYPSERLISSGGGKVAWAEEIPDIRWTMKSSSDIFIADAASGTTRRITYGQRLYAPALSPDGRTIAAVEFGESNLCALIVIDSADGRELLRAAAGDGEFIQTPSFTPDGTKIVFSSLKNGKALKVFAMADRSIRTVMPYVQENIAQPVSDGRHIFYSSDYSGIDNIYAADIETGARFQVTSRRFGAYSPALSPDGRKLAYSDLTEGGYQVVEVPLNREAWTPIEKTDIRKVHIFEPLLKKESAGDILSDIPVVQKNASPYFALSGALSPAYWVPGYDSLNTNISLYVVSANYLQTISTAAGGTYNKNEHTASAQASVSYLGFFPVLEISGVYGNRYSSYEDPKNKNKLTGYSWFEKTAAAGISVPLNFSRGLTSSSLVIGTSAKYTCVSDKGWESKSLYATNNGAYMPCTYYLTYARTSFWATDIKPRWGQIVELSYTHTPYKLDYNTSLASARMELYFPGVLRRHSLYFEGGLEHSLSSGKPLLTSAIMFPRGYRAQRYASFAMSSANYTFPLFYPENSPIWTLGLGYIKQVYANVFFDAGVCSSRFFVTDDMHAQSIAELPGSNGISGGKIFRSAGTECVAELLPFCYPISFHTGYRVSHLFDAGGAWDKNHRWSHDLVLSIVMSI